jgi:phosphoglycolate phosphatase-like HAD superfamily hydrolase
MARHDVSFIFDIEISPAPFERLRARHSEAYGRLAQSVRPLPGALALLEYLTRTEIPWAIAARGRSV